MHQRLNFSYIAHIRKKLKLILKVYFGCSKPKNKAKMKPILYLKKEYFYLPAYKMHCQIKS